MKKLLCTTAITLILLSCGCRTEKSGINHNEHQVCITDNNRFKVDTNNIVLTELIVINEDFNYILDTILEEYIECENSDNAYHFSISIQNTIVKDSLGVKSMYLAIDSMKNEKSSNAKSIYISRSYYKGFVSKGYGFFYYREKLFVINGQLIEEVFRKTNRKTSFSYKYEPIVIFDPPRWLFCYLKNKFYCIYSSPCGG